MQVKRDAFRKATADLSRGLERIGLIVRRAEDALVAAKASRSPREIADVQQLVEEAWGCIAYYREEARLHPATEAYVARASGQVLATHEALALLAPVSSTRIRASARIGPSVASVRPAARPVARRRG